MNIKMKKMGTIKRLIAASMCVVMALGAAGCAEKSIRSPLFRAG